MSRDIVGLVADEPQSRGSLHRKEDGVTADLTNPALADLDFLVGDWDMTLSGASFLPGPDQTFARLRSGSSRRGHCSQCGRSATLLVHR